MAYYKHHPDTKNCNHGIRNNIAPKVPFHPRCPDILECNSFLDLMKYHMSQICKTNDNRSNLCSNVPNCHYVDLVRKLHQSNPSSAALVVEVVDERDLQGHPNNHPFRE